MIADGPRQPSREAADIYQSSWPAPVDCTCNSARALVAQQAEDEALWFQAETAPEAYLQAALRKLHAAVEGEHGL